MPNSSMQHSTAPADYARPDLLSFLIPNTHAYSLEISMGWCTLSTLKINPVGQSFKHAAVN